MPDAAYRMYFGKRAATQVELDRIEEITVEQEMDMAWEARVRLFLCLDEDGHWRHGQDEFAEPFSRVRVEVSIGDGAFVPLIDGPVAGFDTAMDSQPGRSNVSLVVRDDSVLLNRDELAKPFKDARTDEDAARAVFAEFGEIVDTGKTRIQSTGSMERVAVRRGTAIAFLRELAHAHGFHAYVLPGEQTGNKSIGCFLPDPDAPGTLPDLKLMGADRNLADIQVTEDSEGPQSTSGHTLRLSDQGIVSTTTGVKDLQLLRDFPPLSADKSATRLLRPELNDREDVKSRTLADTRRASYAYRLSARIIPGCYKAVLQPYQKVRVLAGDTPYAGAYLITKVTHRITPSIYTQQFEAKGDSRSDPKVAPESAAGGAGVSVNFSASISIF